MNNDFNDIVFNRHSIKKFDENVKIDKEEMLSILEEASKAPSSINMQPWRFLVVDSKEGKKKLEPLVMFNTKQNNTSSAMIVVFGDLKCYDKADEIYSKAVEKGYMTNQKKERLMDSFVTFYENAGKEKMNDIVHVDASLMCMQLMLVARKYGYDTCPIGGFDKEAINDVFDIDPNRYVPIIIIAIGKEDYIPYPSVRLDIEDITKFN